MTHTIGRMSFFCHQSGCAPPPRARTLPLAIALSRARRQDEKGAPQSVALHASQPPPSTEAGAWGLLTIPDALPEGLRARSAALCGSCRCWPHHMPPNATYDSFCTSPRRVQCTVPVRAWRQVVLAFKAAIGLGLTCQPDRRRGTVWCVATRQRRPGISCPAS